MVASFDIVQEEVVVPRSLLVSLFLTCKLAKCPVAKLDFFPVASGAFCFILTVTAGCWQSVARCDRGMKEHRSIVI